MHDPSGGLKHLADQMGWLGGLLGEDFWAQLQEGLGAAAQGGGPPPVRTGPGAAGGAGGQAAGHRPAGGWGLYPPVEVYATPMMVVAAAQLPGITGPDQVGVSLVSPQELVLEAFLAPAEPGAVPLVKERPVGYCVRSIPLPAPVRPDGAQAAYADGVLELHLYRLEPGAGDGAQVTLLRPNA